MSVLTKLALVMAIGECISSVVIAVEHYAGSVPEFAVLFALLFFTFVVLAALTLVFSIRALVSQRRSRTVSA